MSKGRGSQPPSRTPAGMPAQAMLQHALALHREGRLDEARPLYRQFLRTHPRHFDALHLLGILEHACGDPATAASLIGEATRINRRQPAAFLNLGIALGELGRLDEALASFERALKLEPGLVEALNNSANVLKRMGRYDEALAAYDRLLARRPELADGHYNRGNVLRAMGRPRDALESYDRALALRPDDPEAWVNRGAVLFDLRRLDEALAASERALELRPGYAQALSNRGNVLRELGRLDEALESYDCALASQPGLADALANRASCLVALKRHVEAVEAFDRLLALAPDSPWVPGYRVHAMLQGCDWSGLEDGARRVRDAVREGARAATPFSFLAISDDPADELRCARTFATDRFPSAAPLWRGERYARDRIRLAYLSADLRDHATAWLIAELLETHDRERFEVFAFSYGVDDGGAMRRRLERAFDHFFDVAARDDRDIATLIREHEIDIAIDLKGYTQDGRPGILAHRPAPVQVSYLGYPGTLGAPYIDYIIADRTLIRPGEESAYDEQVVRLPDTYQPNDALRPVAGAAPPRDALGLPAEGLVFCCFNNAYKITPEVFDLWMRLLGRTPGSVLWLLEDTPAAAARLRREAAARAVDPARLVFAPRAPLAEHLARHRAADLFLDTWPVNAHTTASDALWSGLPVLTREGETFAGRVAASLLRAADLPELVTRSASEYEELATTLAADPARLRDLRDRLERQRSTCALFDTARLRHAIEAAYVRMHRARCDGLPPDGFDL